MGQDIAQEQNGQQIRHGLETRLEQPNAKNSVQSTKCALIRSEKVSSQNPLLTPKGASARTIRSIATGTLKDTKPVLRLKLIALPRMLKIASVWTTYQLYCQCTSTSGVAVPPFLQWPRCQNLQSTAGMASNVPVKFAEYYSSFFFAAIFPLPVT